MTFRGTVRNSKTDADNDAHPAKVATVVAQPVQNSLDSAYRMFERGVNHKSIPTDLSAEHDHYAHGAPPRARRIGKKASVKKGAPKPARSRRRAK